MIFFFFFRQSMVSFLSRLAEVRSKSLLFRHFLTELEINIKFPTCWDGVNVEDINGNHVIYSEECDGDVFNECFDFDCPESHPVRMPEIHLYVRVLNYEGGAHVFSNDTDVSPQLDFLHYLSFPCRSSNMNNDFNPVSVSLPR